MRVEKIAKPDIMILEPKQLIAKGVCPESAGGSTPSSATDVNEDSLESESGVCKFKSINHQPSKAASSAADEQALKPVLQHMKEKAISIFESVRKDCIVVEENMKTAEDEARYREDLSFMVQRNEAEIAFTQTLQKD